MKKQTIGLNYKNKKFSIEIKKLSEFGKIIGLMFSKKESQQALLFKFKKPTQIKLHSWFVFYKFLAIWTDDKNKIIEKKIIKPWKISISPKKPFSKLIEIPLNKRYKKIIRELVED